MTEAQYNDYVVANGKKVEIKASDYKDIYVTDLHGFYAITVVAVNGNQKTSQSVEFTGLDYKALGSFHTYRRCLVIWVRLMLSILRLEIVTVSRVFGQKVMDSHLVQMVLR